MNHDIFISYSRHDTNVVNELVALLEQEGYSVWIDRDGIESGDAFKKVILRAIKDSSIVLYFSSEFSNQSEWTAKEIGVAVKYKKQIIPIMLDGANFNEEVEFDLINLDYVDYSKTSTRLVMRERLLKALRNKLGNGSKEKEQMEAERIAKEEAERARLEKERIEREEAERKAKEAAERERQEREQKANKASSVINGHEYVDLGLPSGTLWATCNIGANKPEDYGDYFAWGEIRPKATYDCSSYKYANGKDDKMTKYCNKSYCGNNGFTDNLTELQSGDDPATTNWGSGWQMPSKTQWDELIANTTNQWTIRNGVKGRLFTSKKNGRTLFLPAAGDRWDSDLLVAGYYGNYWSSSLDTVYPSDAWILYFDSDDCFMLPHGNRGNGFSVRPVRQK